MFLFNIWLVAEGNIFLRPGRGGACSSRSNDLRRPVGRGLVSRRDEHLPQTGRAGACCRRGGRIRLNDISSRRVDSRIDRFVGFNLDFIAYFFARTKK